MAMLTFCLYRPEKQGQCRRSMRAGRVPNGQQTVKVRAFECANGARVLQHACERGQSERIQGARKVEKLEVAETGLQRPITHGGLRVDTLLLLEPGERALFVAQFVDELEFERLPT